LEFQNEFFLDEVIEGFYVPGLMKRAWAAELQLLSFLDGFCKKNQISYFLDCGALLGIVRHKGFIPWDDDLDISMYRKDFRRLAACIEEELPEEIGFYYVGKDRVTASSMAAIGMKSPSFNPEKQEFFKQFPFYVGVDIRILEDVLDDEKEEERKKIFYYLASLLKAVEEDKESNYAQLCRKWKKELADIREAIHHFLEPYGIGNLMLFPKDGKSFMGEIYYAMDSLYSFVEDRDTKYVAWGPDYALRRKGRMRRSWYLGDACRKLSLYGQEFSAPSNLEEVLKEEYGDYLIPKQNLGGHFYPFYKDSEKYFHHSLGEKDPYRYFFLEEDLRDSKRNNVRSMILESFAGLERSWKNALEKRPDGEELKFLCQKSQEDALAIGNAIETRGSFPSVSLLESFCTMVFRLYECVAKKSCSEEYIFSEELPEKKREDHYHDETTAKIYQILKTIENAKEQFQKDWKIRVVFLAYSYSRFEESLAADFQKILEGEKMDAYLLPVPYGFKNVKGELRERIYEGKIFQKKYQILDYESLNLQSLQADILVTPVAFDYVNPVFSLDPFYDTNRIKEFTPNLIYYPDFIVERAKEGEEKSLYNQRYYIPLPGIAHCDFPILPKEDMLKGYLHYWRKNVFSQANVESYEKALEKKLLSIENFQKSFDEVGEGEASVFEKLLSEIVHKEYIKGKIIE